MCGEGCCFRSPYRGFILAIFGAFNYPYLNVIFSIWVKGLDKKCVVIGVVLEVLFWLFLVHLIIITQMLFSLFSH